MKNKLFISTPCYDSMVTMQYTTSLLNLVTTLNQYKIEFMIDFTGNESLIPRARNSSLGKFMSSGFTHLLFIDSDIEFPAKAVIDLLLSDKDVVCCSYAKKGINWNRLMHSLQHDTQSHESLESRGLDFAYNAILDDNGKIIKDKNLIRVRHASTGFMMIKRSIVAELQKKHTELEIITDDTSRIDNTIYGLFCCMIKNKQYLSEDYSFCERVNEIGGTVWIDTTHNLNHIGKYVFRSDIQNRTSLVRSVEERKFYS